MSHASASSNPTLALLSGEEYTVELTNGDGAAHDYVLQDGDEAEIEGTDVVSGEGETWSLTFTATAEMAQYVCTTHPTTWSGASRSSRSSSRSRTTRYT